MGRNIMKLFCSYIEELVFADKTLTVIVLLGGKLGTAYKNKNRKNSLGGKAPLKFPHLGINLD